MTQLTPSAELNVNGKLSSSVDENLPYVYLNAIESWDEDEIIILIDGKGWKENAMCMAKGCCRYKGSGVLLMIITTFMCLIWVNGYNDVRTSMSNVK